MNQAEGSVAQFFYALVAITVALAIATVASPYVTQYRVKQAAQITCNAFTRHTVKIEDAAWREDFTRKARIAGANLKSEQQYLFKIEKQVDLNRWRCTFKVAWNSQTPIFLIGAYLPDLPQIKLTHRIDDVHDVSIAF
ncbi:MAG: hypothetical protein FJ137_01580 [Deltaproteobacteria bacterium]|nr:hypothetical protein [Deltaproteobacteria bacterium]